MTHVAKYLKHTLLPQDRGTKPRLSWEDLPSIKMSHCLAEKETSSGYFRQPFPASGCAIPGTCCSCWTTTREGRTILVQEHQEDYSALIKSISKTLIVCSPNSQICLPANYQLIIFITKWGLAVQRKNVEKSSQ